MPRLLPILFLLVCTSCNLEPAADGLVVYYVRHAETVANITHKYTEENQQTFTDLGKKQLRVLTKRLDLLDVDTILVSPTVRTRSTILPYLEARGRTAEIWPELTECCWERKRDVEPTPDLKPGKEIVLDPEEASYFSFRDSRSRYRMVRNNYADGIRQVQKAHELLVERFAGTRTRILVVGHRHSGGRLIELLQGLPPDGTIKLENAALQVVQQADDGSFRLAVYNDEPL